jgi:hypothetical protein
VPADIEPPELARLVDFSERPRTHDWSLRSALVRYAQPQPQRVNDILDLVRRTEWALGKEHARIARDGNELWQALERSGDGNDDHVIGLLRAAQGLDGLGDVLATWAVDRADPRPDEEVDCVLADVGRQLEALGVPHEERQPPPGRGRRGV